MTNPPIHGRITGPIVMIGFGSIGKGMLPLIERHFEFDRSRFVVIDPSDKDRQSARRARHSLHPQGSDAGQLSRDPDAASHRGRRAGILREPVRRHVLARHHGTLARTRCALHRHGRGAMARVLFRQEQGRRSAHQLRPARDHPRCAPAQSRRTDRGVMLRRQSRHGVMAREAGLAQSRERYRHRPRRAAIARGLGAVDEPRRRQGYPHRRARHAARHIREADGRLRQHLVGRRLRVGRRCSPRNSAGGRTRNGCRRTAIRTPRARRRRSICCSREPTPACARGRQQRKRSTRSW